MHICVRAKVQNIRPGGAHVPCKNDLWAIAGSKMTQWQEATWRLLLYRSNLKLMAVDASGDCSGLPTARRSQSSSSAMVSTRARNPLPSSPTPTVRSGRPPTTPRSNRRQKAAGGSVHSAGSASSKLGSAALDSDDDFIYSDAEAVADQPVTKPPTLKSSSSVKSASSTGSRTPLPLNIEKALLQDILKSGGIAIYDAGKSQGLCRLLDSNKELFGSRGDNIRSKISQRVKYLKKLPEDKFLKVVSRRKVKISKAEAAAAASNPPSAIRTKSRGDVSDLEDLEDYEDFPEPDFVQGTVTAKRPALSSPEPVKVQIAASTAALQPQVVLSSPTPVKARPHPAPANIRSPSPVPAITLSTMNNQCKYLGAIAVRSMV